MAGRRVENGAPAALTLAELYALAEGRSIGDTSLAVFDDRV